MSDTCDMLMDSSVLLELVHENNSLINELIQEYAGDKKINFIILEDILTEWFEIGNVKQPYLKNIFKNRNELKNELKQFGTVAEIPKLSKSEESIWVEKMYLSKKYVWNLSQTTLSINDYRLLQHALTHLCTLVTLDILLVKAYCNEVKDLGLTKNVLVPKEWIEDDKLFKKRVEGKT